jgi:serine/threonine protein kinase
MVGQTMGPYSVLAKLGEGGMGEVYRARDTRLDHGVSSFRCLTPPATRCESS